MKAVSLHQPWASLIAIGEKRIETRSWYRRGFEHGELAIHASKTWNHELRRTCVQQPCLGALVRGGFDHFGQLPFGAVIAVAQLLCVVSTDYAPQLCAPGGDGGPFEMSFGDYSPGRYAWVLKEVRPLATPVPCRGHQQLWNLDADVEAAVRQQLGVAHAHMVTARKPHKCHECHQTIEPGQKYERVSGLWSGRWERYRFCLACSEISKEFSEDGRTFGEMWSTLRDNWDEGANLQACLNRVSTVAAKEQLRRQWQKWKGLA